MIEITEDQNVIVDGVLYEAIDGGTCDECAFGDLVAECKVSPCSPKLRLDMKEVIFVKAEVLKPVLASSIMTLRDHFAGQAMMGVCGNPSLAISNEQLAQHCYRIADAMMKARGE